VYTWPPYLKNSPLGCPFRDMPLHLFTDYQWNDPNHTHLMRLLAISFDGSICRSTATVLERATRLFILSTKPTQNPTPTPTQHPPDASACIQFQRQQWQRPELALTTPNQRSSKKLKYDMHRSPYTYLIRLLAFNSSGNNGRCHPRCTALSSVAPLTPHSALQFSEKLSSAP
jgi:hypothetical protein